MARLVVMYRNTARCGGDSTSIISTGTCLSPRRSRACGNTKVNKGPVATPAGPSGIHLIAILHFDDMAAIQSAFASAEGQAAASDLQNFATGGADLYFFDNREV